MLINFNEFLKVYKHSLDPPNAPDILCIAVGVHLCVFHCTIVLVTDNAVIHVSAVDVRAGSNLLYLSN